MIKNNMTRIELIAIEAIFALAFFSVLPIISSQVVPPTPPTTPTPAPTVTVPPTVPPTEPPTVHNLDTGEDFRTIDAAIADSDTADGDTIIVDAGNCIENVNVTKSLTIKSTSGNPADTIVQAKNSYENVFKVTANWVNITGFTVRDATAAAGIYLDTVANCSIMDNVVLNNSNGIHLYLSTNNELVGNNASDNDLGILLDSSSNNTLKDNTAANDAVGFILGYSSDDNTLTNNSVSNNEWGIALVEISVNNRIFNNYFNNTNNAYDEGNNTWNLSKTAGTNIIGGPYLGGNCWSDYAGSDNDGDGLGNILVPYNSSGTIANEGDYLPLTEERVNQTVGPGDTVTTDPEGMGPTVNDPVETSVTTPTAGTVSIEETPATEPPPEGFYLIGQQVTITAPDVTPEEPLTIVFKIHALQIPPGGLSEIVVFKDGVPVEGCTGDPGQAWPDPCISSRVMPNGDGEITVLTASASVWVLGSPILTPVKLIEYLINSVNAINLQHGIENSLDVKLEAATNALLDTTAKNDVAAINSLQAFINAVEAQRGHKITDTEADELIAATQEIIASLT